MTSSPATRPWWARRAIVASALAVVSFTVPAALASDGGAAPGFTFLWIALLLLSAKVASLIERIGQPAVLGELIVGVAIGNFYLLGVPGAEQFINEIASSELLKFLAELGVVILLFQIGLESSVSSMRQVGVPALMVATVGVITPMVLGTYVVGPWLLPDLSFNGHLFLGATLTATSVGITGRVFQDLNVLQSREAQIVLGAAVIDDVMGLIILAAVSAIVTSGDVDALGVAWITVKALLFLVGALVMGRFAAPRLSRLFSAISTGMGMKVGVLISTCLIFAWAASVLGLAPIVGAFAAGLVLDEVQFRGFAEPVLVSDLRGAAKRMGTATQAEIEVVLTKHAKHSLEELVAPVGHMLVPMFFVYTGMQVKLETIANGPILLVGLVITLVAFLSKLVSGIAAGDVRRWVVGWGMAPRGEVGLIFAAAGKALGVIPDAVFSMIVVVVLLTTLLTPPILVSVIRRSGVTSKKKKASGHLAGSLEWRSD
ncbi:MAG: cation:proton antiporter [Casimicrobiaceae bacterium]